MKLWQNERQFQANMLKHGAITSRPLLPLVGRRGSVTLRKFQLNCSNIKLNPTKWVQTVGTCTLISSTTKWLMIF